MRVYKNWILDIIEFKTYFNILLFTVTKIYILQAYHGDHDTVTSINVGIQLVLFIFTLTYHIIVETNLLGRLKFVQRSFMLQKSLSPQLDDKPN